MTQQWSECTFLTAEIDTRGGSHAVECTECVWNLPVDTWDGHGTPDRPGCADSVDRLMPAIGLHVDYTGHTVRLILITRTPPDLIEESSLLIRPRPARKDHP